MNKENCPCRTPVHICFEGIDGSGKSEQFERIKYFLETYKKEWKFVTTKEPTDHSTGKAIYDILHGRHPHLNLKKMHPFHFQSLYFTDRVWNYRNRIIPALEAGVNVLADRGPASLVFGALSVGDLDPLMKIQENFFTAAGIEFKWPDAIIIFDVPVKTAIHRLKKKSRARDQFEQEAVLRRVRDNYLEFAKRYPSCHVIDANRTIRRVFDDTKSVIYSVLGW